MDLQLRNTLERGLDRMNLTLEAGQIDTLMAYLQMLIKWNKAYNLTAVRDPQEMVSRHLLDSLSVLPYIRNEALIDVGSGPGLPGIPLAICRPDLQITTLDSNGKKTRFQLQAKIELKLDNLTVVHERVEKYQVEPFKQVISRAFASLEDMIHWTRHLCAEEGVFLAMKGLYPDEELAALPTDIVVKDSHRLQVPDTDGERHLLILGRA
ncbi:16S rRNA (guanine(527)-N(7))-methyltransferase RsmG [Pontibacterium granulatum]|uniref:16S rRNA (guanine(527)-N(7))-methyltransferase RsmG n=1 Tax=Pontibacterium granulatum TaxID=2036029 RepID=UPI00249AAE54|nr:16S rRNA (guanine(527)-N(7))-methyltransferase RsmG [Pontibacterium granulatum]MDI3324174.1 16S rRNA (guanine(527)-N(7))-methyltransferase RsmG [Pontibacterium granulatum]